MDEKNPLSNREETAYSSQPRDDRRGTYHDVPREIIEAIRNGDPAGFKVLYVFYHEFVFNYLNSILKSPDDAEDLSQDVFAKIWEKRDMLEPDKGLRSFIYTLARNNALKYVKKKNSEGNYIHHRDIPNEEELPTDEHLIAQETQLVIELAIARMPQLRRKIFLLHHEKGMDYEQIADHLEMDKSAVANHLSRARNDIRQAISALTLLLLGIHPC